MACEVCHKSFVFTSEDDQFDSDAKPHLCSTCGQSFSLKIQLKRHTLLHANGEPYVCINCTKGTENKESKSYNLRLAKRDNYICDVCHAGFSSKRLLFRHTTKAHSFVKTYVCDDCPECFESASDLKKHAVTHKLKNVSKKNNIKAETYVDTPPEENSYKSSTSKNLVCHTCNRSFAYQACLDKHIKLLKCKPANTSPSITVSKKSRTDAKVIETDDKKHVCNICGKSFTRKSALEGHEVSHLKEKFDSPYEEYSDNSLQGEDSDEYVSQPKKVRFSKINIQQSYTCDSCNFVCFSKQTLAKHMNNHKEKEEISSERGVNDDSEDENHGEHKCSKCSCQFDSSEELDQHSLIHLKKETAKKSKVNEEERGEFPCEICSKVYHTKRRLKKHLLFHVTRNQEDSSVKWGIERKQRSKDYACDVCGKRFAGETCLRKHTQKHVNGELDEKKPKRQKKEKVIQTLICEFCSEEFTGKRGAYVKHIHSHTPEVCGICDERFVDRQGLREHCKIHVGTEEGRMFMECSQKALDAKNGLLPPEPKVEYIYLVLR